MNKIFKQLLTLSTISMVLFSCSPTLNYMGNKYTPTQNVDIYFDENDIDRDFKVMGLVKNEAADEFALNDTDSIQKAMIEKAKSVGADGILFLGLYQDVVRGESKGTYYDKNSVNEYSTTNTTKVYEAKFIKYE